MREPTKVILWGNEDIICRGVEIFLRSHCDVEVIRIIGENDYEVLIQEIEKESADVVIIDPGRHPRDKQLPLQLMDKFSGIKVITFDLEDSSIDVYHRQNVFMKQVSDFLELVDKDPSLKKPGGYQK